MGLSDKFRGKGKSSANRILKINKYESKEAVLDLIAHICTAEDDFEPDSFFTPFHDYIKIFRSKINDYNLIPACQSIFDKLFYQLHIFELELYKLLGNNHGQATIQLAVAGGYSSGKSSLLNYLIGDRNKSLLPTGAEPVSLVNTYLTFSKENSNLRIRGKNLKDAYIELDNSVLDSIQHSSKSKVHVASVLKSLHIDLPLSSSELDNVSFIDTPGYNNSLAINKENGLTDRESAIEAVCQSDAMIWCSDIEGGTISKDDCKLITEIFEKKGNIPWIVVLTKRDKKELFDQKKIFNDVNAYLNKRFSGNVPFATLAFSIREDNAFLCNPSKSLYDFIKNVWNKKEDRDLLTQLSDRYSEIILCCMVELKSLFDEDEEKRKKLAKDKQNDFERNQNVIEFNKNQLEDFHEFLFDHYNALYSFVNTLKEAYSKMENLAKDNFFATIYRKQVYEDTSNKYSNALINFPEWHDEKYRQELYDDLKDTYEFQNNESKKKYEILKERYNNIVKAINNGKRVYEELKHAQKEGQHILKECFDNFLKEEKKHYALPPKNTENTGDIFSAIAGDNFKRFTACLSEGVDMALCNPQGYNPLTYIALHGNNEMLKYLIEHDADLSIKDNNGLNAYETAIVNHYKNICELLVKYDPSLKVTGTPIPQLLSKNNFNNWINKF